MVGTISFRTFCVSPFCISFDTYSFGGKGEGLFVVCFFKTDFLCVVLAVLELA